MSLKIIKRDNTISTYDIDKIKNVLHLAFNNSNTVCNNIDELIGNINNDILDYSKKIIRKILK